MAKVPFRAVAPVEATVAEVLVEATVAEVLLPAVAPVEATVAKVLLRVVAKVATVVRQPRRLPRRVAAVQRHFLRAGSRSSMTSVASPTTGTAPQTRRAGYRLQSHDPRRERRRGSGRSPIAAEKRTLPALRGRESR